MLSTAQPVLADEPIDESRTVPASKAAMSSRINDDDDGIIIISRRLGIDNRRIECALQR